MFWISFIFVKSRLLNSQVVPRFLCGQHRPPAFYTHAYLILSPRQSCLLPSQLFDFVSPPFLFPICIMSNYRSWRVSMGSSSVPSHQSLCLCLLVYLLLLFLALSWRPDGTQVSAPHGGSYCKLSLHPQSFKTMLKWDFIYSLWVSRVVYLTYLTQFHSCLLVSWLWREKNFTV